jgi:hypothetical protein
MALAQVNANKKSHISELTSPIQMRGVSVWRRNREPGKRARV